MVPSSPSYRLLPVSSSGILAPAAGIDTSSPSPYDPGNKWLARLGLTITFIAGIGFVAMGAAVLVWCKSPMYQTSEYVNLLNDMDVQESIEDQKIIVIKLNKYIRIVVSLMFAGIVTLCIEATGYIHGTALKWSLASGGKLYFSANLRLFTSIQGSGSNSWPINVLYSTALILAYASSSMVIIPVHPWETETDQLEVVFDDTLQYTVASFLPSILLGGALLLQALLGLYILGRGGIHT